MFELAVIEETLVAVFGVGTDSLYGLLGVRSRINLGFVRIR